MSTITTALGIVKPDRVAAEIRELHGQIVEALKTNLPKALRIGELLAGRKAELPHGEFLPWLATLPFSQRSAYNYVRLHEERDRLKLANVATLSEAYGLLAGPAPDIAGAFEKLTALRDSVEPERGRFIFGAAAAGFNVAKDGGLQGVWAGPIQDR